MEPTDFEAMYDALGLGALLDGASAETPDRTRLNELLFGAFEYPPDARALFLAVDAMTEYSNSLTAHAARMSEGEVDESPAWREMALEWWTAIAPDAERIKRLLGGIDPLTQTRALARLKDEMTPDDFARLYETCGIGPI